MQLSLCLLLVPALIAALPVWSFNRNWSYGPALAVGFLLAVNLLVVVSEYLGRRRDGEP